MVELSKICTFVHPRIYTGQIDREEGGDPPIVPRLVVDRHGVVSSRQPGQGEVVSLPGAAVVPGFIDTHAHLCSLGGGPADLVFSNQDPVETLLTRIAERAGMLAPEAWITGTGWSDSGWTGAAPPLAATLDKASGGRPVALFRHDRHALLASNSALTVAGLTRDTPDPPGGLLQRDPVTSELTGLLIDAAMDPVVASIPFPKIEELAAEVEQKGRQLASMGVTCIHEAHVVPSLWQALCRLIQSHQAFSRVRGMMAPGWSSIPETDRPDRLRMVAVKAFADGALGSRGAELTLPYEGSGSCGLAVQSDEELAQRAALAKELGLQLAVHAIGDGAVRRVLDLFEAVWGSRRGHREKRWRIEHAQIVHPDDLPRLDGVCLATQPIHLLADGPWVESRIGKHRLPWCYRVRSLLEAGAVVGFGSDFPIEHGHPLAGLAALEHDFHPLAPSWNRQAERVPRPVALDGYWQRAAYLSFDEHRLGRLLPGFHADFVCLDGDPFRAPSLDRIEVIATYVGGRRIFPSPDENPWG